jgi:hypothetical protein
MVAFFASLVSFAFFVMGLRDSSVFARCLLDSLLKRTALHGPSWAERTTGNTDGPCCL